MLSMGSTGLGFHRSDSRSFALWSCRRTSAFLTVRACLKVPSRDAAGMKRGSSGTASSVGGDTMAME